MTYREALEQIAASESHALRAFGDGCVGATRKQRIRGSDPPAWRDVVNCPVCFAKQVLEATGRADG